MIACNEDIISVEFREDADHVMGVRERQGTPYSVFTFGY
jgi:hypothetical protein